MALHRAMLTTMAMIGVMQLIMTISIVAIAFLITLMIITMGDMILATIAAPDRDYYQNHDRAQDRDRSVFLAMLVITIATMVVAIPSPPGAWPAA